MTAKPLQGWTVLVPRGGTWGDRIAGSLRRLGAHPVIAPLINFASADRPELLAAALERLAAGEYDWLVVTSATTVDVLTSVSAHIPEQTKVAAVGETTATAMTAAGYRVDFVPVKDNSARGLVAEWPGASGRVLVPQSDIAEPALVDGLAGLGVDAEYVPAYRTIGVPVAPEIAADVAAGRVGIILLSSGSVARQVQAQLGPLPEDTIVAAIGPRTAYDARAAGLTVQVIAEQRSADSLVEAVMEYVKELE
ncbi:uroporphyrinogen-III synthase [soil metagenome]